MSSALEPVRRRRAPPRLDALLPPLALGAGLVILGWHGSGLVAALAALAALLPITAVIVVEDARRLTIPDMASLALALVALEWRLGLALRDGAAPMEIVRATGLDLLLSGGLLWAFREIYYRLKGHDGLGFGDVKLAAGGGLLIGASGFAFALLLASLCGLIFVLARRLTTRATAPTMGEPLPFGTFLAPAFLVAWIIPLLAERIG